MAHSEDGAVVPAHSSGLAGDDLTVAIAYQVSSALGVALDELDALNDCIDPDALDSLFREDNIAEFRFQFNGCWVTVNNYHEVTVEPL